MKAIVLTARGGPENLRPTEVDRFAGPLPEGAIRVKVAMAGVSASEVYARRGNWQSNYGSEGSDKKQVYDGGWGAPPYIAGKEGAGEVIEIGPGVSRIKIGDRVVWSTGQVFKPYTGALAEECVLHCDAAFKIPDGISYEYAIPMAMNGLTAHYLARDCYPIKPGDWAVITTAGGSLGTTLSQILRILGARVIGVVSNDEKADAARESGCEHVIVGYENYSAKVRELLGAPLPIMERPYRYDDSGAAVVYEGLGADWWKEGANCLRVRGMLVMFGFNEGPPSSSVSAMTLLEKGSISLLAPAFSDYVLPYDRAEPRYQELFQWMLEGRLKPVIGATLPMSRAAEANGLFDKRIVPGKILISVP